MTGPAHASLFTGLSPTEHGVLSNHHGLGPENKTLAERLSERGYRSGGFVSCSILGANRGFEQGFEHYDSEFRSAYAHGRETGSALRYAG